MAAEEPGVVSHEAEVHLRVHVAVVMHHARRETVKRRAVQRDVPLLLVVRRLVPERGGEVREVRERGTQSLRVPIP